MPGCETAQAGGGLPGRVGVRASYARGIEKGPKVPNLRVFFEAAVGVPLEVRTLRSKEIDRREIRHFRPRQVSERTADAPLCCLATLGSPCKHSSYIKEKPSPRLESRRQRRSYRSDCCVKRGQGVIRPAWPSPRYNLGLAATLPAPWPGDPNLPDGVHRAGPAGQACECRGDPD